MAAAVERSQRGVSRVLSKLDISIDSGNYYEAHQMYRTLYFRYVGQNKFDECLELLYNGSLKLLTKKQETSAADLGLLLIDTLERRKNKDDVDLWIGQLTTIISRLSPNIVERETLINRAIKWSADISGIPHGHPSMHKHIGEIFWNDGNIEQCRHHFLLSQDGNLCGRILIKISLSKGFVKETDLFIVQAVLQQLCLKDSKTAEDTFVAYTKGHPEIKRTCFPYKQPLLNFIYFLFRSIELNTFDIYLALLELYKPSLKRDAAYEKYLMKISCHYFGVTHPPENREGGIMGGMFGDLFSRLFQGFEDDDDEQQTMRCVNNTHSAELD
ncbi:Golgi to ER traffic protein 4 homolog [Teleopsis dalmanni]|uniref:Golgi to ER traffic protein 4 homolog n=1 Tax=Teleopsis dalmanni TaxID=139649 RepID=UPI0018CF33DE|nr:Golgi to ER traffic protein 4 homolog [Teleopsis dalmanni]